MGNLTIGDKTDGTNISNDDLQGLSVERDYGRPYSIVSTKLTDAMNAFAALT